MAQSSEYPDLLFVPPRAFGRGRDGKGVRFLVVHYTAGAERSTSAEDGAAYDQRRMDGTSTHYFVDSNSVVQCVRTTDRANAAFGKANRLGIQYELCGTVQSRAQWLDAASDATLTNAARQMARDCKRYGIPVRRLSTAETRSAWYQWPNGPRGIVGHVDVTNAYPEDGGNHTDPGPSFPWDVLLARVQRFLGTPESTEDDMAFLDDPDARALAWREHCFAAMAPEVTTPQGEKITHEGVAAINRLGERLTGIEESVRAIELPALEIDYRKLAVALLTEVSERGTPAGG